MGSADTFTESLFTMRKLEDFVPAQHPLRDIRKTANAALDKLKPTFTAMYAAEVKGGRPSIAPEKLFVGADRILSRPADLNLSQGILQPVRGSAVDKFRLLPGSTSLLSQSF